MSNYQFEGDSYEYEILTAASKQIKDVDGLVLEIGTRLGKGIHTVMESCRQNDDSKRFFLGVDPYGEISYAHGEQSWNGLRGQQIDEHSTFNLDMMNSFLANMYAYNSIHNMYYQHFLLEDSEFMKRYADGVVIYHRHKTVVNNYALVLLDGPHSLAAVEEETRFFSPRMSLGGVIVYDDIGDYKHTHIDSIICSLGFHRLLVGKHKISYIKYERPNPN